MEYKTKFLLTAVNAKYIHSNPAIYSLKAYAKKQLGEEFLKNKIEVELVEYTINQYERDMLSDIFEKCPGAIAFSCYIWNWAMIKRLIPEIAKVLPDTDIWIGGPEVSFDAGEIMKQFPQIKGVFVGEGEETCAEVIQFYGGANISLEDIKGLWLKSGYTGDRELSNMSEMPFLYDDLNQFENKIIYYESSRGCPYRCSYCLSSIDKRVRLRDFEIVKNELQFFLDNKVSQVKFVDRTFNCNREHTKRIWNYITEHDNGITNFHFEVSADILQNEEIELLSKMRPGLTQLEIGVQSTNPKTIEAINRKMDVEKLAGIVSKIRAGRNVHQHLDLIAGLPYEDYETFGHSFDRVYAMKPDQLQLGFLKVLKGSPMKQSASEYGIEYLDEPPYEVLKTNWISYKDILKLKKLEEVLELFYNSGQFKNTLDYLERLYERPFVLYEELAEFYFKNGYNTQSSARVHRYEAMLEFVREKDSENIDIYKELLTYDLYLREKMKTRPAFASDMNQDEIRQFYIGEASERKYLPDYTEYDSKQLLKMTHLEFFKYAYLMKNEKDEAMSEDGQGAYILFDYKNREPLNGSARVISLE